MHHSAHRATGLTLIELMIAILISTVITGAVVGVYLTSSGTYRTDRNLAHLQDSARYAIDQLSDQIRQAGFMGCLSGQTQVANDLNNTTSLPFSFGQGILGYEYTGGAWSSTIDSSITNALTTAGITTWTPGTGGWSPPGNATDILVIAHADTSQAVGVVQQPNGASLLISTPNSLYNGEIVTVTNCQHADIFQINGSNVPSTSGTVVHNTGAKFSPGNSVNTLSTTYGPDAEIMPISVIAYVVGKQGAGPPSLWRIDLTQPVLTGAPPQVSLVAANVLGFRVEYGANTLGTIPATASEYVDLATVPATTPPLSAVVGVRLVVLMETGDDNLTQTIDPVSNYPTVGASFTPIDHRLYRVFTITTAIRNRLP